MSPARQRLNYHIHQLADTIDDVIFVGVDERWDYRNFFKNYKTIDINPSKNPDIVGDICDVEAKARGVIFSGVYEFLTEPKKAVENIYKMCDYALICAPAKGYYGGLRPHLEIKDIFEFAKPFKVLNVDILWYRNVENYIYILCQK